MWNWLDITFLASYIVYFILSFTLSDDRYEFKVLQSLVVMSTVIKMNGFLRIFNEFGFLVQMITSAFNDSF